MKCPKCGTETNSRFCPNCGMDLRGYQTEPAGQPSETQGQGGFAEGDGSNSPYNPQTQNGQAQDGQAQNRQMQNGQTQNDWMPNGQMPNGQIPNGQMPNGVQPNGTPPKKKVSGLSIVALVFSFFGRGAIIGVILGVIDLAQHKPDKKHGLSVAAIVLGVIIFAASFAGGSGSSSVESTASNESTAAVSESTGSVPGAESAAESVISEANSTAYESAPAESTAALESAQTESTAASESSSTESVAASESAQTSAASEAETPQLSKEEFIATCQELNYKDIARDPDQYVGQNFVFTAYVMSSREGGLFTGYQKYYVTYAYDQSKADEAVNNGWIDADDTDLMKTYGMDTDVCVWLLDNRDENDSDYVKVLEGDVIRVYGTFTGMTETQNSLTGESGEQVSLDMKYVDLVME